MQTYQLDVQVTRGDCIESVHRVHGAVALPTGALVGCAREAGLVTSWRSCAKPFQVMPFVESGGLAELEWGDDELALACASHGGEPEHVALAVSMLLSIGMEEGDLACGPHEPLSRRGARILYDVGTAATRLHNNCSGKHAAMLARAHLAGWPTQGYERDGHPVQEACFQRVAEWTELKSNEIGRDVDGCGVAAFSLPLGNMAGAFARLGEAVKRGDDVPSRIVNAMRTRPFLVGGTERFDTVLMEETGGRLMSKIGAEGVHSAVDLEQGIGVAIKVEDGGMRAQFPALIRLLQLVGSLPETLPIRLQNFARTRIKNTRGEVVGEVRLASA
ncbi:MAG: asparaginase [Gemmatimonadaceae bacterium]